MIFMVNGAEIRYRRELAGLSGEDVARRVGISEPMLSFIERNIRQPSVATLERLAKLYDCAMSDLLQRSGDNDTEGGTTNENNGTAPDNQ
jgi:transcriptional regulator with XRE-family HTH domain